MKPDLAMKNLLATMTRIMDGKEEGRQIDYWEWNSGVGIFGVTIAYEETKDEAYLEFLRKWVELYGFKDRLYGSVNTVIPCASTQLLYKITGEQRYKEVCDVYADWGLNRAIRTPNGGIAHVWSSGGIEDYKNQLWADSVFMAGVFFATYGKDIGNEKLIMLGFDQIKLHLDCLFDKKANLFYHAYHCVTKKTIGEHWGRGNGWVVASLARLIEIFGTDVEGGIFCDYFVRAMESAYSLKEENGLLHTVISNKESYTESTASMLFGYAAHLGHKLGVLDERFLLWSKDILNALEFEEDGTVKFCSTGTNPETPEKYLTTPFVKSNYADGITLMFLSRFV